MAGLFLCFVITTALYELVGSSFESLDDNADSEIHPNSLCINK